MRSCWKQGHKTLKVVAGRQLVTPQERQVVRRAEKTDKKNPVLWVSGYTQPDQVSRRHRAQPTLKINFAWLAHCRVEMLLCMGTPVCFRQSMTSHAHIGTSHEPSTQPVQQYLFLISFLIQEGNPHLTSYVPLTVLSVWLWEIIPKFEDTHTN